MSTDTAAHTPDGGPAGTLWPDQLMIRDTGLYDDMGGGGQRIYTTAGRGYEKRKYVREDLNATRTDTVKATDGVLMPDEPTADQLRTLFQMNSALPRTTVEAKAIYAALLNLSRSAIDVPTHPEVVKATYRIEHDGFEGDWIGSYVTREGKRGVVLQQAGTKVVHVYGEKWLGSALAPVALSHPEPVAQEAVAWQWRKVDRVMKHEEVWSFVDYHTGLKIKEFPEKYETRALGVIAEIGASREGGALVASDQHVDANEAPPAHPSPSPEQGEDDLVQRLERSRTDFWAHTRMDCIREAATAISTLRARVAELEARATPQAGASEAGAVAQWQVWVDGPDDFGQSGWVNEDAGMVDHWRSKGRKVRPLYATPPDSDAVRALREALEKARYVPGDHPVVPVKIAAFIQEAQRILSNQGSSSNGQ